MLRTPDRVLLLAVGMLQDALGFASPPWISTSARACDPLQPLQLLPLQLLPLHLTLDHRRCIMHLGSKKMRNAQVCRAGSDTDPEKGDVPMASDQISGGHSSKRGKKASLSPLAMAAADWRDDEEDEISKYWERFDNSKRADTATTDVGRAVSDAGGAGRTSTSAATTEELLDSYFESRGINKAAERESQGEIENSVHAARRATSAEEAVRILEKARPFLQPNTKLGGGALLELAECYEAKGEPERADEIYYSLKSNPQTDIRRRVRQIVGNPASSCPKRNFHAGLWGLFSWETWH
jgi:hypothetical protein